ncbi:MAG TPA: LuxR C-terminal-related transcriptional regulator [Polyangiaceae bacterium]|jgi:DNA-binding CsgD family transcriptional regulator
MDETQLVAFLEAVYAFETSDEEWLSRVLVTAGAVCGDKHHYLAFFYDASNVDDFKLWNICVHNMPLEAMQSFEKFRTITGPDFVRATFRSLHVGSARRTAYTHMEPVLSERAQAGWGDIFNINGLDPSGLGCLLTLGCREPEFSPSPKEATVYRRMANHLGAAFRCRRRLAASESTESAARLTRDAEAIIDDGGQVVHAHGPAEGKSARERIRSSVAQIEAARTHGRRARGRDALDVWHPLTSARWTLIDSFEENGRRYVVARENQADTRGFSTLTDRERQVVVHAALGLSNKQIAYALGISDATVRVLMARAAGRLGVRTRKELLVHPALSALQTSSAPSA